MKSAKAVLLDLLALWLSLCPTVMAAQVTYHYDDLGRLERMTHNDGDFITEIDYAHDFLGKFTSKTTTRQMIDSDADLMPNGWEMRYGLDPNDPADASEDILDADGLTNLAEYNVGSDPIRHGR